MIWEGLAYNVRFACGPQDAPTSGSPYRQPPAGLYSTGWPEEPRTVDVAFSQVLRALRLGVNESAGVLRRPVGVRTLIR